MRRYALVAAVLSLIASACTVVEQEVELRMRTEERTGPCRDVEVGDDVVVFPDVPDLSHYLVGQTGVGTEDLDEEVVWSHSGAGTLDSESGTFLSTELGESAISVIVYVSGFRLINMGEGRLPVMQFELTGSCRFSVVEELPATALPEISPEPGTLVYDVESTVVASDMGGEGAVTATQWTFSFDCDDGRCNADVVTTGMSFVAVYSSLNEEVYGFQEFVDSAGCTLVRSGVIDTTEWSDLGPVQFVASWTSTSTCGDADPVVVEWESVGQVITPFSAE